MLYRDFKDLKLSALGLGTMRLPLVNAVFTDIDREQVQVMVDEAYAAGVNYYDTAWGYHGGNAEAVIGNALAKYPRESYFLTTKFPGYELSYFGKVEEIFEKQLERCGVDYFDFYLLHNVCEKNIDQYLDDDAYHTVSYLLEQKKKGRIHHLGASCHGQPANMKRLLEKYHNDLEFIQIQLNWVDYEFQEAREKVALIAQYGLPVWVMEPLRGGMLANLKEEDAAVLKKLRPEETIPAWGFRFLQSLPEVTMILSGMSNIDQIRGNIKTFQTCEPVTEQEKKVLLDLAAKMIGRTSLPCTSCRYCLTHCPMGINIPEIIRLYNEDTFTGGGYIAPTLLKLMPEDKRPTACLGCGSCEAVCPQQIRIPQMMAEFAEKMKTMPFLNQK